jgi:hypothetical protein
MENKKITTIRYCLNNTKASKPNIDFKEDFFILSEGGQGGSIKQNTPINKDAIEVAIN